MTATGVYIGNDPQDLHAFDAWLGSNVQMVGLATGKASWEDWDGSIGWLANMWQSVDVQTRWTIPMFAVGGNLASAAAGDYNSHYLAAAQTLADTFSNQSQIIVRVGEEFNGDWMPWSAQGAPQDYINAFRDFVNVFRSVSDKFVFEWNTNVGDVGMNPETAYPGDKYVDIIGTDFYYNQWSSSDPTVAWNDMVNQPYGLQWQEDFAAAHGKPTAYSEWGVESNNVATYVDDVARWFAAHNPLYQIYWNSNADFAGDLSHGQYPATAASYLNNFGPPPIDAVAPSAPTMTSFSPDSDVAGDGVIDTPTTVIETTGNILSTLSHIATLELVGAGSGSITFSGSSGTLILDHSSSFAGKIINLTGDGNPLSSDQIDLKDIAFGSGTTVSYTGNSSGGILTISDAQNHTANFSLVGNYINSTFSLTSDGNGGTKVIDPPVVKDAWHFNLASDPAGAHFLTTPSVTIGGAGNDAFVFHQPAGGNSGSPSSFVLDGFASKVESSNLLALVNDARSDYQWMDAGHDTGFGHPGMNAHFGELHAGDFMIH